MGNFEIKIVRENGYLREKVVKVSDNINGAQDEQLIKRGKPTKEEIKKIADDE